jgi:membrane-associated phospholipid phosphatase
VRFPNRLEHRLSSAARSHPPGQVSRAVAIVASPWLITLEGLVLATALRASGRPSLPVAVAAPLALTSGKVLKRIVARPRPGRKRFGRMGRQSFPSTHVAGPVALLACLACIAPPTPGWRTLLAIGGGTAIIVGIERVCAGAHWASDVVGGAAFGALVGTVLGWLARTDASGDRAPEQDGGMSSL